MRNDLTDIIFVVDRSGSMIHRREDAEGGINTFIEEQKKVAGDAIFTLVQFDDDYEFVYNGVPIKDVPNYELKPRGMTALLDAVGRAINEVGERLAKMPESNRPGCVIFAIVTDGHENSSKEFKKSQIKDMITHQREKYNWQFTFLGADAEAYDDGVSIGVSSINIMQYAPNKMDVAYTTLSNAVSQVRYNVMNGGDGTMAYTDEDRSAVQ